MVHFYSTFLTSEILESSIINNEHGLEFFSFNQIASRTKGRENLIQVDFKAQLPESIEQKPSRLFGRISDEFQFQIGSSKSEKPYKVGRSQKCHSIQRSDPIVVSLVPAYER